MIHAEANYAESVEFLRSWSTGLWVLTAINPEDKSRLPTETFSAGEEESVLRWLDKYGSDHNIYFSVNPPSGRMTKKTTMADIAELAWLHVDVDPRAGEPLETEQARILSLFTDRRPTGVPEPTFVVFSGGGYQGFWRLQDPLLLGSVEKAEAAKLYNLQLELLFGADSCHNVDRIMRLPGTVNRPDAIKRRKGREPATARVAQHIVVAYPLARFTPAATIQNANDKGFVVTSTVQVSGNVRRLANLDELGTAVTDRCKSLINMGVDLDNKGKHESRSELLWHVVCELVRAGIDDETIYSIITDPSFKISAHILDQANPEQSALRNISRARERAIHPRLLELNEQHAVVEDHGGKCRIISEVEEGVAGRTRLSFQTAEDFKLRYMNQKMEIPAAEGGTTQVQLGNWWLSHPSRRQYRTIVFAPEVEVAGSYNLWKGFAYPSKPGNCELLLSHIKQNVCCGNVTHYDYLMGWMASAVQNPASPGHSAVVMRGAQGTGKSFVAKAFGSLFGRHFLQVADPKHLVGAFNAHLRDCVVLFGDEAFYAGDKKHESVLKMLVTEETITIEAKGVDAKAHPNYVHLMMASNDDWVVPAGAQERRFFVLDVSTEHQQDNAYFAAIQSQLNTGGYEAFLYLLRTLDLKSFNVRSIPQTRGLQEQKVLSYTAERDWWYAKLCSAEILPGHGWPEYTFVTELSEDYANHVRLFNPTARGSATRLGMFISKCFPPGTEYREQLWGVHVINNERVNRPSIYRLPTIQTCRKIWDDNFGGPFQWPLIRIHGDEPPPF